jgi:hypothetical protein
LKCDHHDHRDFLISFFPLGSRYVIVRNTEFGFDFCWGFDSLAIHSHQNEMEQKRKKTKLRCSPGRLRGLPAAQREKKQAE